MPQQLREFRGLGIIEGSGAPAINGVDFAKLFKQEYDSFQVTAEGGKVKRRASVVVPEVQINVLAGKTQQGLTATTREHWENTSRTHADTYVSPHDAAEHAATTVCIFVSNGFFSMSALEKSL